MANYYGTGRSNYFKVKDLEAFEEWAAKIGLKTFDSSERHPDCVAFEGNEEHGGLPDEYLDESENIIQIDFWNELSKHLVEGEVAIFVCSGAEKLRYIDGWATAVDHRGKILDVSTEDIYSKVKRYWKKEPTRASY